MSQQSNLDIALEILDLVNDGRVHSTEEAEFEADVEDATVVCAPGPGGIVGSKQMRCAECQAAVWMSPPTQASVRARGERKTRVICVQCFKSEYGELLPQG